MTNSDLPDPVLARAVAAPLRRRILDLILAADHPVTIAELTDELGCNHNAVRQHLAQLREAGLVAEVLEHRTRPGRPRLLYTATARPNPYARLAGCCSSRGGPVSRRGRPAVKKAALKPPRWGG